MNTSAAPATSTVKARRTPLAQIDVHSASAAAKLGRVLPAESSRPVQSPIFNSAL
ncbi:FxSxx-COOH cyclophane-containing RiPP peptide [Streptomyces sp. NPDC058646]|uniref:FxSxx-COOH cyclophane-containing RiPP peptide n=1 Tax=Streptomyces sp. NPDC058646 TaxID=3346574 RepID=UPI003659762A